MQDKYDLLLSVLTWTKKKRIIIHYYPKVQYDVNGFLAKNCDYLPPDCDYLLKQSEISLIRLLFTNSLAKTGSILIFLLLPDLINIRHLQ